MKPHVGAPLRSLIQPPRIPFFIRKPTVMTKHSSVDTGVPPTRAAIVRVQSPEQPDSEVEASVAELRALLEGLGMQVEQVFVQKRHHDTLGSGRLKQIARDIGTSGDDDERDDSDTEREPRIDLVAFDGELAPGDARRMQKVLDVPVIDRAEVILRVFRERARSREAQLEIELAQLEYEAPRLRDDTTHHGRQGGGGRGGKGHTGVELDKQRIRQRTADLRRQLEELHRARQGNKARRQGVFQVALVGYTNAGKSSLMRALTSSDVLVKNAPFATLGTTVRALSPETTPRILVSDTVGFIRNLPHGLIASFRATLAEAHEADLLLNVGDAADPELPAQLEVTREVLAELGAGDVPRTLVLNKVDRLSADERDSLVELHPDALLVSAYDPSLVGTLREHIVEFFDAQLVDVKLTLRYAELPALAEIRKEARVVSEVYTDDGVEVSLRASSEVLDRIRSRVAP